MDPSPLPNPPRGGRKVAICDGDVRREMANEHRLSNAPMSVSAGSKHAAALRSAMVAFFDGSANSRFLANDGQTRLTIVRLSVPTVDYLGKLYVLSGQTLDIEAIRRN
eukprot:scaffold24533_cov96-Skeletonema_menzelii.AAC.1